MAIDTLLRLLSFLVVFLIVAVAEYLWPRRVLTTSKGRRWFCNGSLVFIDSVSVRLLLPVLPLEMAGISAAHGWGLFNMLSVPHWIAIAFAVLLLDLIIYLQHRSFHRIPLCWSFHRMHHTDLDLDVSSGNRFHPIEIFVSLLIKLAAVTILGAPLVAVVIFEVALNASSLFNHGNLRIPMSIDSWLRKVIVTPDMHRVHHSVIPRETDSNFGFNLPCWDWMLKTYKGQPQEGHLGMDIGLKEFRDEQKLGLVSLLLLPFRGRNG